MIIIILCSLFADVGYAGLINEILNEYFQIYYPRAVKVWEGLKSGGYVESFIYTTHPWLVTMYLDCPPNFVLSGVKLQVNFVTVEHCLV